MTHGSDTSALSRRAMLAGLAATPALGATVVSAGAQTATMTASGQAKAALKDAKGTKLVILGTAAGPVPGRPRKMTSHVMLSNGAAYVLDCGLGVTDRYAETGIPFGALRSIFITHHHFDHNVEYGPLLSIGWVQGMPLTVKTYGPPPLKQMTADYIRSMRTTIDFWAEDLKMKPLETVDVTEVPGAGPVMQDDNVKVSSVVVNHPPVKPALGYRFDFHDRSIAFSGDTTPLDAVAQMAKGADVLVHEAMYVPAVESYVKAPSRRGPPSQRRGVHGAHEGRPFAGRGRRPHCRRSRGEDARPIALDAGNRQYQRRHLARARSKILFRRNHCRQGFDGRMIWRAQRS
jgi:phosphoribosyl 1,2-cyclic phosphodiesterase